MKSYYGYDNMENLIIPFYRNRNGKPIARTPISHPYNYDTYVLWKKSNNVILEHSDGVDSDRMMTWNWDLYNKCCMEVWNNKGQSFSSNYRKPEEIEKFLCLYYENDTIVLTMIEEWCNQSSGYPGWHFTFTYNGDTGKIKT